jgi:hypothetical protein
MIRRKVRVTTPGYCRRNLSPAGSLNPSAGPFSARTRAMRCMRIFGGMSCVAVIAACLTAALAQPPGPPPDGQGPPSPGREGPPPPFMDPLRAALDANKDHRLDADEIKNAPEALAKLDKNGDGAIDHEELRPPMPPRPMGPPGGEGFRPGGEDFRGPPRDGGPEGGFRRPPPGEGPPGGPPRDGEGGPRGEGRRGPDGPPAERGEFRRPGGDRGGAGGPGGPGQGGPTPERIVERAMSFDADGDGKLDRSEMQRFAEEMVQRMRSGPGGPPAAGGDRGPRPDGDRGPRPDGDRGPRPGGDAGPRPDGERGPPEGGDRPERPRRPE